MPRKKSARQKRHVFLNAGCGNSSRIPRFFKRWRQVRVDIDPGMKPDVVASIADLSPVPDGSVDAIWCSHCIEHLYAYQVPRALAEFRRVLCADGFACIIVPDLQTIVHWIAADKLHETIYESKAGPVTAHDMIWGFGPAIASGKPAMAHSCGFAPTLFLNYLKDAGFGEIVLRRKQETLELAGLALQRPSKTAAHRQKLMTSLGL